MKLLDCTLRDGGYYNNWNFERNLVNSYLEAMKASSIDMVELGLRNFDSLGFYGPFYYTSEQFLETLVLPDGPEYGVMVDAKTLLSFEGGPSKAVERLFCEKSHSKLSFVRVAFHFKEIDNTVEIVNALKGLGYQVIINLMQITEQTDDFIRSTANLLQKISGISALYFADSLGSMRAEDVSRIVSLLKSEWRGIIGIHAHNNMGLALNNTLAGISVGVELFDSTVAGMGRGAGNVETESMLVELETQQVGDYKLGSVGKLAVNEFGELKSEFGWGPSIYYFLAAKYRIHPTYIQTILSDNHFGEAERLEALSRIPLLRGMVSFDKAELARIFSGDSGEFEPAMLNSKTLNDIDIFNNDSAVLIANGQGLLKHFDWVINYLSKSNLPVFNINEPVANLNEYVDYCFFLHNGKLVDFKRTINTSHYQSIIPLSRFSASELNGLEMERIYNYPVSLESNSFRYGPLGGAIPEDLTAIYAISALIQLGVKKILLIGFDGYGQGDVRQKEMSDAFSLIVKMKPDLKLVALTETTYPVEQRSIYAPL